MSYVWLFLSAICSVLASIALKSGAYAHKQAGHSLLSFAGLLPYGLAVGAYGLGFVLYAIALKRLDLSLAYPLMVAISIVGVVAYGMLVGHEAVSAGRMLGAALVGAGIFFLSR